MIIRLKLESTSSIIELESGFSAASEGREITTTFDGGTCRSKEFLKLECFRIKSLMVIGIDAITIESRNK